MDRYLELKCNVLKVCLLFYMHKHTTKHIVYYYKSLQCLQTRTNVQPTMADASMFVGTP